MRSLHRYHAIDLHVDPRGKAPIQRHHIIPITDHDAILSLLLALEGSVAGHSGPKRMVAPSSLAPTVRNDQVGNGWISGHLLSVSNEIDPLNWTSFCEGESSDNVHDEKKSGLWWGKLQGNPSHTRLSLWDFAGPISTNGNQNLMEDLDNSWSSWAGKVLASKLEPHGGNQLGYTVEEQSSVATSSPEALKDHCLEVGVEVKYSAPNSTQDSRLQEQELAATAVQALAGVMPAIRYLEKDLPGSSYSHAASISKLVRRLCRAGRCRSWLEELIDDSLQPREHTTHNLISRRYVDHIHYSFASAIQTVLRWHTAALLHLMESVKDRREQESLENLGPAVGWTICQDTIVDQTYKRANFAQEGMISQGGKIIRSPNATPSAHSPGGHCAEVKDSNPQNQNTAKLQGTGPGGIDATLVELVVHTKRIQHQTMVLASICGCPFSSAGKGSSPVVSMDVDGEGRREQRTFELPEAADLLGLLHRALLEADNILGPMIRYLFTCSFQPYLQHVRQWLFTSTTPSHAFLQPVALNQNGCCPIYELIPCTPPEFLSGVHDMFTEAGQQLRILQEIDFVKGSQELVAKISSLGSQETAEVQKIVKSIGDEWGTCDLGFGEVALEHLCQFKQSSVYFPVPFRVDALHKALEVMSYFSRQRMQAVESWLHSLKHSRDAAKQAEDARIKASIDARLTILQAKEQQQQAEMEADRRQKNELLQEYKAAAERSIADRAAAKSREQILEQEVLEASARQEYDEAAALVSSELQKAKKIGANLADWGLLQDLEKQHNTTEATAASLFMDDQPEGSKTPEIIRIEVPGASPERMQIDVEERSPGVANVAERSFNNASVGFAKSSSRYMTMARARDGHGVAGSSARKRWGKLTDPRPPAGSRTFLNTESCRVQEMASTVKLSESIRSPVQRTATETYRTSRSRWKIDTEKGIILEEADENEEWMLGGEESLVPVSAIVDALVIQPIITQFRCVSYACSEMFLHELGFLETCGTLGNFFFMGAGDWALGLTEHICLHAHQHGQISNSDIHKMLSRAFQESSLDGNEAIERVTLQVDADHPLQFQKALVSPSVVSHQSAPTPSHADGSERFSPTCIDIQLDRLQALDSILLKYDIPWPLCLVLTPEVMQRYANVFTGLLKYRLVEWWLSRVWWKLRETAVASSRPVQGATKGYERLRMVHIWYMDANTLVRNLREFMQHQLLLQHWEDLKREVMAPGSSLQKVQDAHDKYLRAAATSCFLDSSNVYRRLRTVVDQALQNILAFCCAIDQDVEIMDDGDIPVLIQLLADDSAWEEITRRAQDSIKRGQALFRMLKYRANRGEVAELFILMTFNSYYQDRSVE